MIPTIMLAGFIVGVLPRMWALIGVIILTLLWPIHLAISGVTSTFGETASAGALAFANAIVGAAISRYIARPLILHHFQR